MASESRAPRLSSLIFAALVAAGTCLSIWFILGFWVPRIEHNMRDAPMLYPLPAQVEALLDHGETFRSWAGVAALLLLTLFIAAVIPRFPSRLRHVALVLFHAFTLSLLICGMWLVFWATVGSDRAYQNRDSQIAYFRHALDTFALSQAAERGYEHLIAEVGGTATPLKSDRELPPAERVGRLRALAWSLEKTDDPAAKRQYLGSAALFRDTLQKIPKSRSNFSLRLNS